jgi:benzylsuccinate CoA-transferase BbsF subunit
VARALFDGVRILDLTWAYAGPVTIKYFADQGAEVIHVESRTRPDPLREMPPFEGGIPGIDRSAYCACLNSNKYSLALNLKHPRAKSMIERLVNWADIVAENFAPGAMARLGMSYDDLVRIKPSIIMYSTSQQGQTGRHSKIAALGTQLVALSGFTQLTGWPDREPTGPFGPYPDSIAAPIGAAAIAAALDYRHRTGKGMHIDLSQYEAAINFSAPVVLDYTVNRHIRCVQGNRSQCAVPHGVFPCKGDDCWCAIAVFTDEEWQALCEVIGNPDWVRMAEFATLMRRKENEDALELHLASWTVNYTAEEIMYKLQAAGVPAGIVAKAEDVQNDPQLAHRHYFWKLHHREIGEHSYEGPPFMLSKTPAELNRAGPCLGQDTEYVCRNILGIDEESFSQLLADGVFE